MSKKIDPKIYGLSLNEYMALSYISKMIDNISTNNENSRLSKQEYFEMQKFLEHSLGDIRLNKILKKLQLSIKDKEDKSEFLPGITSQAVNLLINFSYRSKFYENFENIAAKLEKNWNRVQNNMILETECRISLEEFGMIKMTISSSKYLKICEERGLLKDNEKLEQFHDRVKKIEKIIEQIKERIIEESELKSGDLLMEKSQENMAIRNQKISWMTRIYNWFSQFAHTSVIHVTAENKTKQSHIDGPAVNSDITLSNYLKNNIYRIDVVQLIPLKFHNALQSKYGVDWETVINKRYQDIQNSIHQNTSQDFAKAISGIKSVEYKAGIASLLPFGHTTLQKNDLEKEVTKINDKLYKTQKTNMLCSEFAAKTIVKALYELNKDLTEEGIVEDIQLGKQKKNAANQKPQIIDMVFERERFSTMHPERLLKVLQKKNCVIKLKPSKTQEQLFKR